LITKLLKKSFKEKANRVNFLDYYNQTKALFEKSLKAYLDNLSTDRELALICDSIRYSALLESKRVRAVLVLLSAEASGLDVENAMPLAIAIELIHTYSLIHDDLPCMDNSDYRRGKLTNHKVYGEAIAVLAGDAMMTLAYEILAKDLKHNFECEQILEVISLIGHSTGVDGMVGGQVLDIESEGKNIPIEKLKKIHRLKTGALIAASVMSSLKLAKVDKDTYENMSAYAHKLGLAFQIIDDILDEVGDQEKLGKPVGGDKELNKATYVSFFGLEKARELAKEAGQSAVAYLDKVDLDVDHYKDFVEYIITRDN
jgi:geranylgeranyl diphosphate synthase, type II